ncbi:MAG: ricin-type beta-trefoil lectin domain protein [Betaproteobacteria bacterium]|nr:ricin-type beta-trefoil lectin domain protein [Betaproteobacteria bacterium]
MVLHEGCTSTKSKFRVLAGGQIQHISSGKCIHPHGGSAQPKPNTSLVLYDGCTGDRLKFAITESSKFRSAPSIPKGRGNRIVHNYSGICVHPEGGGTPKNNTRLVFNADDCSNKGRTDIAFDMLPSGAIRHIASGKCVHPYGGWDFPGRNTVLVLHDGCDARTVEFKFQNGLLFHKMSGMCVHPKGGKTPPRKNDRLVLWDSGCHGERYKLKMVPN